MIKRLKENDNLKKKGYFKNREHNRTSSAIPPPDKEAAPELRADIRSNVRESQQREANNVIVLLVVATLVTTLLIFTLLYYFDLY